MAVARIKMNRTSMRNLAVKARVLNMPKLVRELSAAVQRNECRAEVGSDELRAIRTLRLSPAQAVSIQRAWGELLAAERSDRLRKQRAHDAVRRAHTRRKDDA